MEESVSFGILSLDERDWIEKKKGEGGGDKRIWIDRCFDWDKLEGVIFSERFHFLSIRDGENFSRGTMAICSRGEV